jgi:hypothetical protein
MGATDGTVIGATKILDNGPDSERFNLVILSEGYLAGDLGQFASDANSVIQYLQGTPPFTGLMGAINAYRIDVSSTERGADDPAVTGGTGAVVNTYFDATYGASGVRRALVVDDGLVIQTANVHVPAWHMLMVIVNSDVYGGTGGSVAVFSLAPSANEIAVHEMGHTAFGLADEYEYYAGCGIDVDHDHHPNLEPTQPNVTIASTRDSLKWKDLVATTTAVPTMGNPDCTTCDSSPSTAPAGVVGAFEGAHYYHCGAYRPEFNCKMRALGVPFCAVCKQAIEDRLSAFVGRTWHVADLTAAVSAANAVSDPSAYVFDAELTQHVDYRSSDGHVRELWWNATEGWHAADLSAITSAPAASGKTASYAFDAQSSQHVVYRAANGHLEEMWWDPAGGWHKGDLTAAAHGPLVASDPNAYVFDAQGTQHVIFRSGDGHIHELWWNAAEGWHNSNLSALTHAPAAAGVPTGYVFAAQSSQHVIYRGHNGHIHELWWATASGWHVSDLTALTGAPVAESDPAAYVFDAQASQHLLFRSGDGHIHELWWSGATGWRHGDLTAITGAPSAEGKPAGYVLDADSTQHVAYRGADGQIHALSWDATDGWQTDALGVAAPTAAGDPATYVFESQSSEHILYRDTSGHIIELWRG